jgi:hypothetical protein
MLSQTLLELLVSVERNTMFIGTLERKKPSWRLFKMQVYTSEIHSTVEALPLFPQDSLVKSFRIEIQYAENEGTLSLLHAKLIFVEFSTGVRIRPGIFKNGKHIFWPHLNLFKILGPEQVQTLLLQLFHDEKMVEDILGELNEL